LRIQIVDDQSRPMFDSGKAEVKGYMRDILQSIGAVLSVVPNRLTIEGHTDAKPFSSGERGYSNWELSADRANASRRELIAGGLAGEKVLRMQGLAASLLYEKDDPESPLNRRISIVVMNREAEDRFFQAAKVESSQADEEATDPEIPAALANPIKASSLPTERR
jgi:chemotaxis protein MotB